MQGSAAACSFCWVSSEATLAALFFSHLRAAASRAGEMWDLHERARLLTSDLRLRVMC